MREHRISTIGYVIWFWRFVVLFLLLVILVDVRKAHADVVDASGNVIGPLTPFLIANYVAGGAATTGPTHWVYYQPDPTNSVCPAGQWVMRDASIAANSSPSSAGMPLEGGWFYRATLTGGTPVCETQSMAAFYSSLWSPLYQLTPYAGLVCPPATELDTGTSDPNFGNCLSDITSTTDTVNGWVWGAGVIFIMGIMGWLLGNTRAVLDAIAED